MILIIKTILRVALIAICAYGMGVLAVEMYHERLDLHGFDAIAALFGFVPFAFLCGMFPVLIYGMAFMFIRWLFKS